MIRIEQPKSVVVHDGLDVSVVDGVVTVRPTVFLGGQSSQITNQSNQSMHNLRAASMQAQANATAAEVAELERLARIKAFREEGDQAHDAVLALQMAEHERLQRLNQMGYAAFSQSANQSISDIAYPHLSGVRQTG